LSRCISPLKISCRDHIEAECMAYKHEMIIFVQLSSFCRLPACGVFMLLCDVCVQLCQLSRDGEAYHDYCLNYSKAMSYLEQLRKKEDFCEFEKVTTLPALMAHETPTNSD